MFESDSHQVVTQTCLGEEMVRFSLSLNLSVGVFLLFFLLVKLTVGYKVKSASPIQLGLVRSGNFSLFVWSLF